MVANTYKFSAEVWRYPGFAGWHFVSVPRQESREIKLLCSVIKRGWGSIPVKARIGKTSWLTSIFPDKGKGYLMAIKASVRKKELIKMGDKVSLVIEIRGY